MYFSQSLNVYFSQTFLLKDFAADDVDGILAEQPGWKGGNWQMLAIIEEEPNCKGNFK